MNASLEYLADSLIIEALARDNMIIIAQDNIMESVASGVKNYVLSQFDKDRPIASVVAFMGPGLLWSMDFKWMSVLYTVAEALGFDWRSFWSAVGKAIAIFVKGIISSGQKATEDSASNNVNNAVQNAFMNNFTGQIDQEKLVDIARNKFSSHLNEALEIKAIALRLDKNPNLVKNAGVFSLFKGKLARFFIRTISWLVKTALISLGFVSAVGVEKSILPQEDSDVSTQAPIYSLKVSPNAPSWMFDAHNNDLSSVWIEHGDIENISNILKGWILAIYPQLNSKIDDIENSSGFQDMENKFNTRNRLASGLNLISIPRPYQKKSEIVSEIVNRYLKESQQSNTQSIKYY
jgi:hypothetical protein